MGEKQVEREILRLVEARKSGKTVCPSEVARALAGSEERRDWEPLMEPVRAAARRLVREGKLEVTQGGVPVDASAAKGPIRLRRR